MTAQQDVSSVKPNLLEELLQMSWKYKFAFAIFLIAFCAKIVIFEFGYISSHGLSFSTIFEYFAAILTITLLVCIPLARDKTIIKYGLHIAILDILNIVVTFIASPLLLFASNDYYNQYLVTQRDNSVNSIHEWDRFFYDRAHDTSVYAMCILSVGIVIFVVCRYLSWRINEADEVLIEEVQKNGT